MAESLVIVDRWGIEQAPAAPAPRDLQDMQQIPLAQRRQIDARYDAAQTTNDMKNYWAAADSLDANSANSKAVRQKLRDRSRYEGANNGYTDGIYQTHANFLVGKGPQLRMRTGSEGFNRMVETAWRRWAKVVMLRRKLWTMAHAKVQDGEGFALLRSNPGVRHEVKLDVVPFEAEQCTTPWLPYGLPGYIDGIQFDDFGNPEFYDVLPYHPGGTWYVAQTEPERVPAKFVLHWFMARRAGTHRGVPEMKSTMNLGGSSRRWREAVLAAAETAADYAALLKTSFTASELADIDPVAAMSTLEIQKRMMTALPMGWEAQQMRSEHPNTTYSDFHRQQVAELGRPKCMPYNVSAADSSSHNFASGKLDREPYFDAVDIERLDGDDLVLDPLFDVWFEEAVLRFGWNVPIEPAPPHAWDWPQHPVADVKSQAAADDTNLGNGSTIPSKLQSKRGEDWEDYCQQAARDYNVTPEQFKAAVFSKALEGAATTLPQETADEFAEAAQ